MFSEYQPGLGFPGHWLKGSDALEPRYSRDIPEVEMPQVMYRVVQWHPWVGAACSHNAL